MALFNVTCINGTNVNCTGNATFCRPCDADCFDDDECDFEDFPLSSYAKARIIIYGVSFLLSLLGNCCVMLVTLRRFFRRENITAFKLLITHLAFVDLIFSCNTFVLIPNELYNAEADDGLPMCTVKRMLRQTPLAASIGTMVIIAVERYRGITKDFRCRKWTLKRVFLSLLVLWVISFVIYLPTVVTLKTTRGDVDCEAYASPQSRKAYAAVMIFLEYVLPVAIMAFCNYKIIRVIRGRREIPGVYHEEYYEKREKEQRRTVRILIAVVLGFALLALPNQIFVVYLELADYRESLTEAWDVLQLFGILLLLHTSFNPAVYSIMDSQFRNDVKELCCFCFFRRDLANERSSRHASLHGSKSILHTETCAV